MGRAPHDLKWPESASLPEILKSPHFDVNAHYTFARYVAQAGPAAPAAAEVLISCIETFRRQTDDPAEQEKLRASPWSRYANAAPGNIADLLAAFRAMGKEGSKAIPSLISLYEAEAPTRDDSRPNEPIRANIIETLRVLGEDLAPLAAKWVPRLVEALESGKAGRDAMMELGAYGPLARSQAMRLLRGSESDPETIAAFEEIAPDDPKVRALEHLAKFSTR